ncbi:MAG: hypothetical protein ACON5B_16145 [Myxococcota bacterium]
MTWNKKYWNIIEELYWVPSYIGLQSIPRKHWDVQDDVVSVPRHMTHPKGPLYRRVYSGQAYWDFIKKKEETFNHIFDLALAIAPGDVIAELFGALIGATDLHPYEVQGHDIRDRYAWIGGANVTTPDAFLICPTAILAIELKFDAKTSTDQLSKYVALIAGEELLNGRRDAIELLYIFPSDAESKFAKQTGIHPRRLDASAFSEMRNGTKNKRVQLFFDEAPDAVKSVLDRLHISCITWQELSDRITNYSDTIDNTTGGRTLKRLLDGLRDAIQSHPLSRVSSHGPPKRRPPTEDG